jgi:hypothetical protein
MQLNAPTPAEVALLRAAGYPVGYALRLLTAQTAALRREAALALTSAAVVTSYTPSSPPWPG